LVIIRKLPLTFYSGSFPVIFIYWVLRFQEERKAFGFGGRDQNILTQIFKLNLTKGERGSSHTFWHKGLPPMVLFPQGFNLKPFGEIP